MVILLFVFNRRVFHIIRTNRLTSGRHLRKREHSGSRRQRVGGCKVDRMRNTCTGITAAEKLQKVVELGARGRQINRTGQRVDSRDDQPWTE